MPKQQRDEIFSLIEQEKQRQIEMIGLIPSENAVSPEVSEVLSSCLSNKYSEGYSNKRYYEGVIAQFFYVGAQIMVWTFIIHYATTTCKFATLVNSNLANRNIV